ncbi:hypothetical protein [Sporolactobacillus sp. THM19-2]|uniref:hypothetical protein n=1 Tax=Sporolactobacillus sp. THM19-2 TaxID=2511171 RepID=UPI00101ED198|nr:hypothetical protein [Sporolactobacillus sp. THM19-2]RYL91680.1 hypothetical protein EWH91_08870 [Sporolactobacillus sp. THM19-2]
MSKSKANSTLNNRLGTFILILSWLVFFAALVAFPTLWLISGNIAFLIAGVVSVLGILFNIYLFSRGIVKK